ncbi:MAG: hypothetical protein E7277_10485 [Lachnospiraceae bacterium]|jgi:glycopeptide antibiotics resistance protein|nr:hypothetical protein [Lachnospiraceae bacterium]
MNITWIDSIKEGLRIYVQYGMFATFLIMGVKIFVSKKVNFLEIAVKQMFVMYLCCVVELVFFPLPTMEQAAELSIRYQIIPFHFIVDLMKDSVVRVICQVLFNIVMTIPLGMFLKYGAGFNMKETALTGLGFTAFIEVGQLTGLYFLFKGSYRLFDVDDLMLNVLGTMIGYMVICVAEKHKIPKLATFDRLVGAPCAEDSVRKTMKS